MLANLIAAVVVFGQAQGAPTTAAQEPVHPGESAVQIVQKVLARYSDAKTISGVVNMTQTAAGVEVKIGTQLQFEKPSKIFMKQVKAGQIEKLNWLLVSDGETFAYDRPSGIHGNDRFREKVTQHRYQQTIRDMYSVQRFSISDPNPMIDIAIGRTEDLRALMGQWVSMKVHGPAKVNGQDVTAVVGSYVDKLGEQPTGTFEAYFNKDYDFVRYVLKLRLNIKIDKNGPDTIDIISIWDSTLKVDGPVDPALFRNVG